MQSVYNESHADVEEDDRSAASKSLSLTVSTLWWHKKAKHSPLSTLSGNAGGIMCMSCGYEVVA